MPPRRNYKEKGLANPNKARRAADFSVAIYKVIEKIVLWGGIVTALIIGSIAIHRINKHINNEISTLRQHEKTTRIPSHAVRIENDIYEIKHDTIDNISGFIIVTRNDTKNSHKNTNSVRSKGNYHSNSLSGSCYSAYAKGAKWKTRKNYVLDTRNNQGLSDSFLKNAFSTATITWNNALDNKDIFGILDTSAPQGVNMEQPDGRNEIHFAYIEEEGVLAMTIVWGIFSGPEEDREILEFDQVYNEHFSWGDANNNPSINDCQNTMTHECGHASGMMDIYENRCSHITMYGYASAGETKKRTLAQEDINGLRALYRGTSSSAGSSGSGSHRNPSQNNGSDRLKMSFLLCILLIIVF